MSDPLATASAGGHGRRSAARRPARSERGARRPRQGTPAATAGITLLAVAVGGAVGAGLRYGLDLAIPHSDDSFPLSTLLGNVVGSFVLALLVARVWPHAPGWLKAGLGTGMLGSFTTFSALMVSLTTLGRSGEYLLALAYLAATLVAGLLAALLGLRLGRGAEPIEADE